METLAQENINLAQDLETSLVWENNALNEISLMLSRSQQAEERVTWVETWIKLAEERVAKAEIEFENALEQETNLNLCNVGLKKTIKELKEKIKQEESSLLERQ